MAQRQQQEQVHRGTVKTLDNDYVRSNANLAKQQQMKHRQKVLSRRRLAVFTVFATAVCVALVSMMMNQNTRLAEKEAQKIEVQAQLTAVKEQQDMLKLQIAKLEDDEYIAKLARKEYFLSEEGEIIFTIPKDNNEKEEDKQ
ncbi:septum formation initiator family protein [Lysinibacillus sp. KU-BSD001]|uniref:FtsB family cell division protein n=1 Tax=Lysinibacillus sp. KU-BSD001 TaxID=3141328 RepID=UPI0036E00D57